MTTRRLLTNIGIGAYLTALLIGLMIHGLNLPGRTSGPGYFFVWDMFCGWNGYEMRRSYIGEGESGTRYDLSADALAPMLHGSIARDHYDFQNKHVGQLAAALAERTGHEPLSRIYVVEELWSKQANLSPRAYERVHGRPYRKTIHRNVLAVVAPDGTLIETHPTWLSLQHRHAMMSNPVLAAESRSGRQLFAAN